ncbi:hypothetical protein Nepgr_020140 [Nepenthes gracilis]|uniref:NB-ARC domain-containing protein n=1 Tax=Nepenthes gracilis TaxID=150966 RepID=A0AAD3XVR6_NEPGR|nr:hypothetical protein Nepgr_020140 [Nepenthes gracilis]
MNKFEGGGHRAVPIISMRMGGSGKTTLARKIYNHNTIKQHFQCQIWISISQEWSVDHILIEILRQATGQKKKSDEIGSIEELVEEVRTYLEQKFSLIVLDDVWEKEALKYLLPAFPFRNKGSKIIITTRISEIVQISGLSYSFYEPRRLNNVESWDLLTKIVLNQWQVINNYQLIGDFERLGKEMLKKCSGLPLAIIALSGILCSKDSIEEWETISKNVSTKVMEGSGTQDYGTVKDVLALSYNELPYNLKPCFLYLALFPEDFLIPVGKLIRMWISEGFITEEQRCGEETLEDVARQFLDELIQRNIVQVASRNYEGKVKRVQIHDLIRELCIKKAKKRDFLEIYSLQSSTAQAQVEDGTIMQSRRVGIYSSLSNTSIPSQAQNPHLRSLFVFQLRRHDGSLNLASVHENFRLLKVLNIVRPWPCSDKLAFPIEIGNLIHLRYLGIQGPLSIILPKSIVNLKNLFTLDCRDCKFIEVVPKVWWKLYRLRHLLLRSTEVPPETLEFHTLRSLQTLWGVRGGDWMLKQMSTLSPTVKKLGINTILTTEQLEAVFQCPSFKLGHLHTFSLKWRTDVKLRNIELSFLCHGLRKLKLSGPIGEEESSPANLFPPKLQEVTLAFSKLKSNETMTTLGKLPNLRYLYLNDYSYISKEWTCSAGEFPQLEHLEIQGLQDLEEWRVEERAMPNLSFLSVYDCPRLTRLPKLGNNVVVHWEP